jgi:hypothetical protein
MNHSPGRSLSPGKLALWGGKIMPLFRGKSYRSNGVAIGGLQPTPGP